MRLKIGDRLSQNIRNTYQAEGEKWLSQLPTLVEKYLAKWKLEPDGEFSDLTFNFVLPVKYQSKAAVLKLGPHVSGLSKEAKALQIYNGDSAVQLYLHDASDGALLLERASLACHTSCQLRHKLKDLGDDSATQVAAALMQRLLKIRPPQLQSEFTNVEIWGLGFEKYRRSISSNSRVAIAVRSGLTEEKVLKAESIFKDLCATTKVQTLLHGDLHHANILRTEKSWTVIDPKGVWGDPAYEPGAFIRNPIEILSHTDNLEILLKERINIFSASLGLDPQRISRWAYAQCVLATIWSLSDHFDDDMKWMHVAASLERLCD